MSEVNAISSIEKNNIYNSKSGKSTITGNTNFSSYLEETKSLDDIFAQAAKKYNVPQDLLKAIGKAESNFNAKAVSKCGAQGIMQLMPATAKSLGVTDSFDAEQNVMGGAKYISELLEKYDGNTSLALAAYNAGMGNVAKYGGIPPFEETQNYVVKVTNYMKQNIDTGTTVTTTNAPPTTIPKVTHYYKTIPLTSNTMNDNVTQEADDIFSYQDYLKILEMFLDDEKEEVKEEDSKIYWRNLY